VTRKSTPFIVNDEMKHAIASIGVDLHEATRVVIDLPANGPGMIYVAQLADKRTVTDILDAMVENKELVDA